MENYDILSRVVPDLARVVTRSAWLAYMQLRAEGVPPEEAGRRLGIPRGVVVRLELARKCILKWNGDTDKVAKCIRGEIDP